MDESCLELSMGRNKYLGSESLRIVETYEKQMNKTHNILYSIHVWYIYIYMYIDIYLHENHSKIK